MKKTIRLGSFLTGVSTAGVHPAGDGMGGVNVI